ncbi:MAG: transketolase [Alphaproteobacteria bacterium]|nr:transketolase [Alphaproteobacteria bacterium]
MFKALSNAVRFLSIFEVGNANSGHLGLPLGMADCLTALFRVFLVFDPENPTWPNRDRFILSGGHGSAMLYALLYLTGYKGISLQDLKNFRQLESRAHGHPEYAPECGIELTTGALGQGLANAVGVAIEERLLNARLGDDCINHYTYVCVGDGELMEGVTYEACSLAGTLSLGHLIVLLDDNGITIDGKIDVSNCEDILKRFEACGWHIQSIDGHNENEIIKAITLAKKDPRPSLIICKTHIGFGTPRQDTPKAHSGALTNSEINEIRKKLNWPYAPFDIPEYIEKTWKIIGKRNHDTCLKWIETQAQKYGNKEFDFSEEIQKAFRKIRKEFFISRPFAATRTSSKDIISRLMKVSDFIVSGSCDLGSSTGCYSKDMKPITKTDFSGNYIHYGIREHAMGAIMNGIAAGKKIRCFGGTFFAFSDYMRPAIRMSALMNIPTIFVFSHDSIGVGEDGATHQPIEHLAALRAIPNLNVFRPADAMETMECWEYALESQRPSVIVLTRQEVLSIRFSSKDNLCKLGGYLLHEDSTSGTFADITLIATGSEVSIALETKKMLNERGISVNVSSLPCWNLFDEQSEQYRDYVLGQGIRVGIEASNGFGWCKYLGDKGLFFGVNNFGKSAPATDVYKYFGLTAENICNSILSVVSQNREKGEKKI